VRESIFSYYALPLYYWGGDYFDGAFCCGHIKGLEENGQAGCKERRLANTADQPDVDAPEALEKRGECETGC